MSAKIYQFTGTGLKPITSDGLTIGQRVYQAHHSQIGVITEEGTGHSFGYTVTFPDGSQSSHQQLDSRSPFTRITLVDGIVSALEVAALKVLATQKREADRAAQAEAKNQHAIDTERFVKELRAAYSWVKTNNASANLKKELTKAFPGIKFSVRSDHNSIRIGWIDGPTSKQVEAVSNKYEDGRFDGMTDCHEYDHSAYGEAVDLVLGRATYVFPSRSNSPRFLKDVVLTVCMEYNHDTLPIVKESDTGHAWLEGGNVPYCNGAMDTLERKIYQTAAETAA